MAAARPACAVDRRTGRLRTTDVERASFAVEGSARLLHGSLELEDLLKHLLRSVMGRLVATKGFVALDSNGCGRSGKWATM